MNLKKSSTRKCICIPSPILLDSNQTLNTQSDFTWCSTGVSIDSEITKLEYPTTPLPDASKLPKDLDKAPNVSKLMKTEEYFERYTSMSQEDRDLHMSPTPYSSGLQEKTFDFKRWSGEDASQSEKIFTLIAMQRSYFRSSMKQQFINSSTAEEMLRKQTTQPLIEKWFTIKDEKTPCKVEESGTLVSSSVPNQIQSPFLFENLKNPEFLENAFIYSPTNHSTPHNNHNSSMDSIRNNVITVTKRRIDSLFSPIIPMEEISEELNATTDWSDTTFSTLADTSKIYQCSNQNGSSSEAVNTSGISQFTINTFSSISSSAIDDLQNSWKKQVYFRDEVYDNILIDNGENDEVHNEKQFGKLVQSSEHSKKNNSQIFILTVRPAIRNIIIDNCTKCAYEFQYYENCKSLHAYEAVYDSEREHNVIQEYSEVCPHEIRKLNFLLATIKLRLEEVKIRMGLPSYTKKYNNYDKVLKKVFTYIKSFTMKLKLYNTFGILLPLELIDQFDELQKFFGTLWQKYSL